MVLLKWFVRLWRNYTKVIKRANTELFVILNLMIGKFMSTKEVQRTTLEWVILDSTITTKDHWLCFKYRDTTIWRFNNVLHTYIKYELNGFNGANNYLKRLQKNTQNIFMSRPRTGRNWLFKTHKFSYDSRFSENNIGLNNLHKMLTLINTYFTFFENDCFFITWISQFHFNYLK